MTDSAIQVRNAFKAYGNKQILKNFNMKVQRGTIYGLLGASGCGKTTLLSCIVGRKKLDSGDIWVLGGVPGTEESGVPGHRVGYMPQDINLVGEFTVRDAIYYFGRILDMEDRLIEERFRTLKKLLELPPDDRMIKNCSGGQQRRVSFAAAMVHKPELLILDEPTVGLDPVLREGIWNYLVHMAQKEDTAIVITTHYIEEARQANRVGLMREGRLLAEDSPDGLLTRFRRDTLEDVFLILCKRQEEGNLRDLDCEPGDCQNGVLQNAESASSMAMSEIDHGSLDVLTKRPKKRRNKSVGTFHVTKNHLKALMGKNSVQYFRNVAGLAFNFIFPIFEMVAFLSGIGGDIKNINIGVVNDEYSANICDNYIRQNTAIPFNYVDCNFTELSCRFLHDVEDPMLNKVYYDDVEQAMADAEHGKVVGVMYFSQNYSESYQRRLQKGNSIEDGPLDASELKVWLDMSNRQIGTTIKFKLLNKFLDYQKLLFKDCHLLQKLAEIPVQFNYEYGNDQKLYTEFMTPGVLLTIMFFLGTTMTSTVIITDRLEGVWDRSIVAGVSSFEIVLTHFATQIVITLIQVAEVIFLTFVIYRAEYVGSLILVICIVALEGLCGMCFGFWISVISENHNMANIVATGSFYPMILLCGLVWPLEAQPPVLKFISMCLPFTITITSLRNIMQKDWTLDNLAVLNGIGVTVLWIFLLSTVSVFLIKRKR